MIRKERLKTAFPLISLDEFVLGNGIQRLSSILDSSHVSHRLLTLSAGGDDGLCEDTFYSGKYLDGYLFYFSGDKMQPYLKRVCAALEDTRGGDAAGQAHYANDPFGRDGGAHSI